MTEAVLLLLMVGLGLGLLPACLWLSSFHIAYAYVLCIFVIWRWRWRRQRRCRSVCKFPIFAQIQRHLSPSLLSPVLALPLSYSLPFFISLALSVCKCDGLVHAPETMCTRCFAYQKYKSLGVRPAHKAAPLWTPHPTPHPTFPRVATAIGPKLGWMPSAPAAFRFAVFFPAFDSSFQLI